MNESIPTIWAIGPVTTDAATPLTHWQAFVVRMPALGGAETLHLAGHAAQYSEGRVSSPVLDFDPVTATARTRSGRRYELVGTSGLNADARYVWHRWLEVNSVDEAEVKDVTDDIRRRMTEAVKL